MRVVLVNCPWARARLPNISKWWGLDFAFDVIDVTVPFVPMIQNPGTVGEAVLDMEFVSKYKQGATMFVAPYQMTPKDKNGVVLDKRAGVFGVYLPPLSSFQRWEWFFTRLFWDSPVIEVFANETDSVMVAGKNLGPSFELWTNHEFCHWLKSVVGQEDTTHKWFYYPNGTPEVARDEILKVLKSSQLPPKQTPPMPPSPIPLPGEILYERARTFIGADASPLDAAPDEYGCADSCSRVIDGTFGDFPPTTSTALMHQQLLKHPKFKGTLDLNPGNVIISPTGRGNGSIHGHVGIISKDGKIMSNDSSDGIWKENYTIATWIDRYRKLGGFPIFVFERTAV